MRFGRVQRHDIRVMVVAAEGDPRVISGAAERAFNELESRLDSLRGRRFFGFFDPLSNEAGTPALRCVVPIAPRD